MSNFLELLGTIQAGDKTEVYEGDGTSARRLRGRRRNPREAAEYERRVSEVATLLLNVIEGRTHPYKMVEEAESTSDFPLLFGDVIDRSLLGAYQAWPSVWANIARRGRRRDFRVGKAFTIDGATSPLPLVPQGTPYQLDALSDGSFSYGVSKYGRALGFLWEAIVNDDLDALASAPNLLAQAARNTEDRYFTDLVVDSTGPDATYFTSGHGNLAGTPGPLTLDSLQTGIAAMQAQKDPQGSPIFTGQVRLMVPPALKVTANNIVKATAIYGSPGATTGQQFLTQNWATDAVADVVVNPWLPVVDTTKGNTAWYLFADPGIGRPAVEMGFLAGHEQPEVFMKAPDSISVGGGTVGGLDGDFATDGVAYKVRHVLGGTLMDYRAGYANAGS
jgi:hypothetical protein